MDDLIDGLIRLMDTPDHITGPINLGNPANLTMLELAQQVVALTGSSSEVVFRDLPQDDPQRRQPNITLARETQHWEPTTDLAHGLTCTIAVFSGLIL